MLGYVTIDKNELKIREYDVYQAYYCGICKSIGRRIGQLPRMVLSYDAVFLALVLSALKGGNEEILREHCIIHPVKKKPVVYGTGGGECGPLDYAADVMVLLAYHKFQDDWFDDKSPVGFAGRTALHGAYKKLAGKYTQLSKALENALERLSAMENAKSGNLDEVADTFGEILAELFAGYDAGGFDRETTRILSHLGRNLGRWIYVIDALDDYEKDRGSGSYNPLIYRKNNLEGIGDVLYNYLAEAAMAYDLLEIKKNEGIIENILFMGLRQRTDALLKERINKEDEESIRSFGR